MKRSKEEFLEKCSDIGIPKSLRDICYDSGIRSEIFRSRMVKKGYDVGYQNGRIVSSVLLKELINESEK